MDRLVFYLQLRAEVEDIPFNLTSEYLEQLFELGTRNFFGVEINEEKRMLYDLQEPSPGFFSSFVLPN
ncbi:hypothetical protein OA081_00440 [Gammaproteobacteria bacterium]|nr:hypothetical protein [Gammaproteobacteria bacterium]